MTKETEMVDEATEQESSAEIASPVDVLVSCEFDLEEIYDEQISPLMKQILDICKEHDMPMFADFEYKNNSFCTSCISISGHPIIKHHDALSQCAEDGGVNIDKYMTWVEKSARKTGHSSIYLRCLGVPLKPESNS